MSRSHRRWSWFLVSVVALGFVASGCASKRKNLAPVGYVPAQKQYDQGMGELASGKLAAARTTLQRIQYGADDDRPKIEPLVRIGLADATFYKETELAYIDARNLYVDFVTLFGDHPKAPYAQFQAGICSLEQVVNPSRDQTQTHQAIRDLEEVEQRYPASPFAEAALLMSHVAEENLAEHEFLVGKFYLKKKAPTAAADRFRYVLDNFPHFSALDKIYYYLGTALLRSDSDSEARVYLDKLVTDYPHGPYAEKASALLEKAGGSLDRTGNRP